MRICCLTVTAGFSVHCDSEAGVNRSVDDAAAACNFHIQYEGCRNILQQPRPWLPNNSYASAQYELTGASRGLILVYKSYFLKIIFGDFYR